MTEDMLWDVVTTAVVEDDLPAIERCLSEGLNVNRLVANDKWNLLHLHLVRIGNPPDPAIVKRLIELHGGTFTLESETEDREDPSRTISYLGSLHQALRDVAAWVERGVAPPANTNYQVVDGQVVVPASAASRQGIQPVIALTANGAAPGCKAFHHLMGPPIDHARFCPRGALEMPGTCAIKRRVP